MRLTLLKKIIIVVLLIAIATPAIPPKRAEAFLGFDTLNAAIQGIGHAIQGALLGIDSAANTVSASLDTVQAVLKSVPPEYGAAYRALSSASTVCDQLEGGIATGLVLDMAGSVVGMGDPSKSTNLISELRKLALLNAKITCYTSVSEAYKSAAIAAVTEQQKQAFIDVLKEIETRKAPLQLQRTEINKAVKLSSQDIWKAFAIGAIQAANEAYVADTVNDLVPQLSYGSFGKSKDALAMLYAHEYIHKNYSGDLEKQLQLYNLLDSEVLPGSPAKDQAVRTAKAMVEAELADKCPKSYELQTFSTDDIFVKAAQSMSDKCNVNKNFEGLQHELGHIMTQSQEAAKLEMESGKGFNSTRSCKDVTSLEKKIKTQSAEAAKALELATARKNALEAANKAQTPEYVDAVNAVTQATKNVKALPEAVGGAIPVACGLINNPGQLASEQINNLIKRWANQDMSGNLSLWAQFSKTLSKKLFKGVLFNPKQSAEILTETGAGFLTTALSKALQKDNDPATPNSNVVPINPTQIYQGTVQIPGNVAGASDESGVSRMPYTSPRGF